MPETYPDADIVLLLATAGAGVNQRVVTHMRDAGFDVVRPGHGYVFQHLLTGPKTIRELATLLDMTQQGASKVIGEMEQLGWVTRRVGDTDQRTRSVELTPTGRNVVEAGRAARRVVDNEILALLGERRSRTLRRALLAVADETGGLETLRTRRLRPMS